MGPIGFQEVVVILLLALIFLGPKKLPDIASGIGKAIREVRKATADIKNEIELDDAIRKPLEELREATMLPPEELKRRDEERKWRKQQEKEELERQARERENGVTDPVAAAPDATSDGNGYRDEYGEEDYHDPQAGSSEDPDSSSHASSGDASSNEGGNQDSSSHDDPQAHAPAAADTIASPVATSEPAPAPATPPAPGAGSDRTVAMTLPPPMEGSHTPYLPPPKPAAVRRATPPPLPAAALKAPGDAAGVPSGTVPRAPSGATLIGMPPATAEVAEDPSPAAGTDGKSKAGKSTGKASGKAKKA